MFFIIRYSLDKGGGFMNATTGILNALIFLNIQNLLIPEHIFVVMAKKDDKGSCCHLEAVVNIDPRGQIVIPKELRDRAGITEGDKLMVMSTMEGGKVCYISLMRADRSNPMVKEMLKPVLKGISKE